MHLLNCKKRSFIIAITLAIFTFIEGRQAHAAESAVRLDELGTRAVKIVSVRSGVAYGNDIFARARVRFDNGNTIHRFKIKQRRSNQIHEVALNEAGEEVDAEALIEAAATARRSMLGKKHPVLQRAISRLKSDDYVDVQIWLQSTTDGGTPNVAVDPRGQIAGFGSTDLSAQLAELERRRASADAIRAAQLAPASQRVIAQLKAMGVQASADEYVPRIAARVHVADIATIEKWADVDILYVDEKAVKEANIVGQMTGAYSVHSQGFTGSGVKLAVVEANAERLATSNPYLSGVTFSSSNTCTGLDAHMTAVVGVIRSTHTEVKGMAPQSSLWAGGSCSGKSSELQSRASSAVSWGAKVVNLSWGDQVHSAGVLSANDRYFDDVVFNRARLVVKSAGNRGESDIDQYVTSPGLAYNVLTVGGTDDMNTASPTDDYVMSISSTWNPISANGDREKPEVVAPGENIRSTLTAAPWIDEDVNYGGTGTSFAAPAVTGVAGLMIQAAPALGAWPEATKAIVMATAVHNIHGDARLSDLDGAGSVDAQKAVDLTRKLNGGDWRTMSYTCSASVLTDFSASFVSNRRTRVAIAWSTDPSYADYANRPSADLDLEVLDPNGMAVLSASFDNTFEIVDFIPTVSGSHTVRVHRQRCDKSPKRLAVAWFQVL